jgi:hypothetical protein
MKTEKQIIRTIDKLSQYLFLACLIGMPLFLIYNLVKL